MEQVAGSGVLREVYFMQLLHKFWSTEEALHEEFKETWVRLKPNDSMRLMSDITN